MKKLILLIALAITGFAITNCSNDDNAQLPSLFVPAKIMIERPNDDRSEELLFSYNENNQITQIEHSRTEGNDVTTVVTSFDYNDDELLTQTRTEYLDTGFETQLDFMFDDEGTIMSIDYYSEEFGISEELEVTFDDEINQYTVDNLSISLSSGTRDFVFDDNGQLGQYKSSGSADFWTFTYAPNQKGVFADVNTQLALHISEQLLFGLQSDRYFFAKKVIENYSNPDEETIQTYYDNQVFDDRGYLLEYDQYFYDLEDQLFNLYIETKVEYEMRN